MLRSTKFRQKIAQLSFKRRKGSRSLGNVSLHAAATGKDQSELIQTASMHPRTQPGNFSERPRTSLKCQFLRELLCVWSIRSSDDANGEGGITLPLVIQSVPGLLSSLTSRRLGEGGIRTSVAFGATALSKASFYLENSSPLLFLC